jgi:hypothetical protein
VKSFLHKSHAQQHLGDVGDEGAEDQAVRQYRYLLRSAPSDALEAAHAQALSRLSEQARWAQDRIWRWQDRREAKRERRAGERSRAASGDE